MTYLEKIGANAKASSKIIAVMSTNDKNKLLIDSADSLMRNEENIINANKEDILSAEKNGLKVSLIDRLMLNHERIQGMAEGLRKIALLNDPIGEVLQMKTMPNGLMIGQKRVPMGVIGIIYEARPNVTSDAFGLCIKAGSSVILRGGKEAINSNKAVINAFKNSLKLNGLDESVVQLIEDTSRETATEMMRLNKYIDILIPRGGAGLIQSVVKNSTVPVIETGVGNCHVFVDESADLNMAADIIVNAKTQRPGVCNSAETMLVHENIAGRFLPIAEKALKEKNVEIRGDETVCSIIKDSIPANNEDWKTEFLDFILAVKIVKNVEEAINHIAEYSSGHSECIVTENYSNAQKFLNEVDSAAVYVNASTRFTDGDEFGLGAEIGISTQKLHARGPMGLNSLTTTKFIIYGNGQIR